MKIGEAGGRLSLVRVIAAMVVGAVVLGGIGYLFDLILGPVIQMSGWWTVFGSGGFILGGMMQAAREFAVPPPAERRAVRAFVRAREAAEAARTPQAPDAATAPDAPKATSTPPAPEA